MVCACSIKYRQNRNIESLKVWCPFQQFELPKMEDQPLSRPRLLCPNVLAGWKQ